MAIYMKRTVVSALFCAILAGILTAQVAAQVSSPAPSTQAQIESKSDEIAQLEAQINQYQSEISSRQTKQKTLKNDIAILDAKIKKAQLEIKRLVLLIANLEADIAKREADIAVAEKGIVHYQGIITADIRLLDQEENVPTVLLFAANGQFSDFFSHLYGLEKLEKSIYDSLSYLKDEKNRLEEERQQLSEKKSDNVNLKDLQTATKQSLSDTSKQKQDLLTRTKGEEVKYQGLVKTSKANIEKLKNEIYYLQRIGVTAEQAATLGVLVANRIGIRPAFLIAILEIESRLGANVGKGVWTTDMHPRDYDAFKKICQQLGLNPDTTPVSKKPDYGWGGAMGPAQFLPTTWLGYTDRIASYSGHNPPNPWNIEDAFFAAAIKLSGDGASSKTTAGELAAAKAYIGGSPYCSKAICNYYANLAIDKAAAIEQTL
jgi:membrane-bound lytic murein transglycosylase B